MILVPSLLPSSASDAARSLRALSRLGTPAELRIDAVRNPRPASLLSGRRPPLIVTCRSRREGGRFGGTPREAAGVLLDAVDHGAEYIDAEHSLGSANLRKLFTAAGKRRIILSYHNPGRTPTDLAERLRKMASLKPAVVKIAVAARSFADTARVLEVFAEARKLRQPVSAIAMGEFGAWTRILQGALGGAMTFAAHEPGRPTAPGQLPFTEMRDLYRAAVLGPRTKIFGLLGNPVRFSRGVLFHNTVFKRRRKDAVYVNFAADDAGGFMRAFGGRITGLSVTMPFKGAVRPYLDRLEGSAALTGSVNTILRKGKELLGLNTDYHAFLELLRKRTRIAGASMLVVGTGSTAATAAVAGLTAGARVVIAGRSGRKARALAARFGFGWIPIRELASARASIIVNATPVGMNSPGPGWRAERIVDPAALRSCRVLCDFANPPAGETRLAAEARRKGCAVIPGADIFALQARMQSELFLGLL